MEAESVRDDAPATVTQPTEITHPKAGQQLVSAQVKAETVVEAQTAPVFPEVHYLEVSHWWETADEGVLIALGVDGTIHRLTKVETGESGQGDESFWKKLGTAIHKEQFSNVRIKGTAMRLEVVEKGKVAHQKGFDLGHGLVAVPALEEKPKAVVVAPTVSETATLSDVDLLRVRLWRARASHSREAGLALVILSAALFAGAFFTSALILEIGSVSSFVIGVGLLAYEAEPRVKLFPSMSSLTGPLKVVERELMEHGVLDANAVFEKSPTGEGGREVMSFEGDGKDAPQFAIPPLGDGLVHAYELELGDLSKLELSGAKVWLPRVMVEGLGLADRVEMKSSGNDVTTTIEKPYVRMLCVQDFMINGLCRISGCPLTASVGQALARASGKPVAHRGCTYDPLTQKATLKDTVEQ